MKIQINNIITTRIQFRSRKELKKMLKLHKLWILGKPEGKQLQIRDEYIMNLKIKNADLSKAIFDNTHFINCTFYKTNFQEAVLTDVDLTATKFIQCDFSNDTFKNCKCIKIL